MKWASIQFKDVNVGEIFQFSNPFERGYEDWWFLKTARVAGSSHNCVCLTLPREFLGNSSKVQPGEFSCGHDELRVWMMVEE